MFDLTRYNKLLFEKGDELRDIVWDTLEEIGFTVNRYDEHKEDGSIQEGGEIAILEIKGGKHSAATEDVRELFDHVERYINEKKREPIGILIVNHYCEEEPVDRREPFPSDVRTFVKILNDGHFEQQVSWSYGACVGTGFQISKKLSLMTTHDLFEILSMIKNGELDAENARKEIINNRGVFNLKRISN